MYRAKRAALSPKVKRRVGKYELGRTIGEGTFAKVRFAKNTENDEPVAIKILDKEKVQKHRLVEQIRREICTMKLVKHPNVVRLFEVMGSKARIFIVLEYVTGGELFEIIATNGRLKEEAEIIGDDSLSVQSIAPNHGIQLCVCRQYVSLTTLQCWILR